MLIIRVFWHTRHEFLQHLHFMNLFLKFWSDSLVVTNDCVQVSPLPPLPCHRDSHQHWVDGNSSGSSEQSNPSQRCNQEGKRVSSSTGSGSSVSLASVTW